MVSNKVDGDHKGRSRAIEEPLTPNDGSGEHGSPVRHRRGFSTRVDSRAKGRKAGDGSHPLVPGFIEALT